VRLGNLALLAGVLFFLASRCLAADAPPDPNAKLIAELRGEGEAVPRSAQEWDAVHAQLLAALLPKLGSANLDERQSVQQPYQLICWRACRPGADAERAAASKAIAGKLAPDLPEATLTFLLGQLENIGRAESVDATSALLDHASPLVCERARCALQKNTAPEASDKLRAALAKAEDPAWRIALINALGTRQDKGSVALLIQQAADKDEVLRSAAVEALARIGDKAATGAIAHASQVATTPRGWNAAMNSYLLLADKLAAQGEKGLALSIYRNLLPVRSEPGTAHIKCGAIIGLGKAGGAEDVPVLFDALAASDAKIRGAATAALGLLPAADVNAAVIETLKAGTPTMKVALLKVVAERGDKGVLPSLLAAAADPDEGVRIAAYEAMGQVRDDAAIPPLIAALSKAKDKELAAARAAINRIPGDSAAAALVQAMDGAAPALRVEIIQALAARHAESAVPALLAAAEDKEESVRRKAVDAVGAIAGESALTPLLKLLARASAQEREATEKAVAAVAGRIPDDAKRTEPILAALPAAESPARASLLRVLGRLGGEKALPAVRAAAKDPSADIQNAAVRALADWPDASAANDLLDLARTSASETNQILALRGLIRVLTVKSDKPAAETLTLLGEALKTARRPDEKKLILSGIGEVADAAALKMIEPSLGDDALKAEATSAYVRIAAAISGTQRDDAMAALKKVLDLSRDDGIRKQANDALAQIEKFEDYVTAWEVTGPYAQQGKDGPALFDVVFPPEKPDATGVTWKIMPVSTDPKQPWLMDLAKAVGGENRVAYLRTRVYSPKAQDVLLEAGSDDGIKIWLNGKLIHGNNASRSCKPGEDKVKTALTEGWNLFLLKINNGGTDWGACLRLRAPDGSKLPGLRASIEGK